jgi:hypothetical protein
MGANVTRRKTDPWSVWKGNPAEKASLSSKDIKRYKKSPSDVEGAAFSVQWVDCFRPR